MTEVLTFVFNITIYAFAFNAAVGWLLLVEQKKYGSWFFSLINIATYVLIYDWFIGSINHTND